MPRNRRDYTKRKKVRTKRPAKKQSAKKKRPATKTNRTQNPPQPYTISDKGGLGLENIMKKLLTPKNIQSASNIASQLAGPGKLDSKVIRTMGRGNKMQQNVFHKGYANGVLDAIKEMERLADMGYAL